MPRGFVTKRLRQGVFQNDFHVSVSCGGGGVCGERYGAFDHWTRLRHEYGGCSVAGIQSGLERADRKRREADGDIVLHHVEIVVRSSSESGDPDAPDDGFLAGCGRKDQDPFGDVGHLRGGDEDGGAAEDVCVEFADGNAAAYAGDGARAYGPSRSAPTEIDSGIFVGSDFSDFGAVRESCRRSEEFKNVRNVLYP